MNRRLASLARAAACAAGWAAGCAAAQSIGGVAEADTGGRWTRFVACDSGGVASTTTNDCADASRAPCDAGQGALPSLPWLSRPRRALPARWPGKPTGTTSGLPLGGQDPPPIRRPSSAGSNATSGQQQAGPAILLDARFNGVWNLDLNRWLAEPGLDEYLDALALPWYQRRALTTLGYRKAVQVEWSFDDGCWVWHEAKILPVGTFETKYFADDVVRTDVVTNAGHYIPVVFSTSIDHDGHSVSTRTTYPDRAPMQIVCTRTMVPDPTGNDVQLRITDYLTAQSGLVFRIDYHFTRES